MKKSNEILIERILFIPFFFFIVLLQLYYYSWTLSKTAFIIGYMFLFLIGESILLIGFILTRRKEKINREIDELIEQIKKETMEDRQNLYKMLKNKECKN